MKTRNLLLVFIATLLLSGCVVYSFYPLYTEKDLFENDLLIGEWFEESSNEVAFSDGENEWTFEHPIVGKKEEGRCDKKSYILHLKMEDDGEKFDSKFKVHIIKLGENYFLDFFLEDSENMNISSFESLHLIPVHSFAKVEVSKDSLKINWYDQEWMNKLIRENKIRIHHEETDDLVLITAKPRELQKFVTKYAGSEEAFEDGLEVILYRK